MSSELEVTRSSFPQGLSLVEASAGTGKTFNLALGVVRMLLEHDGQGTPRVDGIGAILVVTFTNAATEELVNRIRRFVQIAYRLSAGETVDESKGTVDALRALVEPDRAWAASRLGQALSEMDGLAVFTIHGFCKRVLDEFALESGTLFQADLLQDERSVRDGAVRDWWRRSFYRDERFAALQAAGKPEDYAKLVKTAAAWPDATIEPDVSMAQFEAEAYAVVQAFCVAWLQSDFRVRAESVPWKKDATQGTPEELAETDDLVRTLCGCALNDRRIVGRAIPRFATYAGSALKDAVNRGSSAGKQAAAELETLEIAGIGERAKRLFEQQSIVLQTMCLREVNAAIAAAKEARQALGFNDLLAQLAKAIESQGPEGLLASAVRRRYAAALIDEFQDTDDQQFGIFTAIFRERPLVLIGDPKQAIYAFRGADVHAYLRATREVPDTQRFTLTKNWRSVPAVVEAVNRLFQRRRHPLSDRGITYPPAMAAQKTAPDHPPLSGTHGVEWVWLDPGPDAKTGEPGWFSKGAARDQALTFCVSQILELLRAGWSPGQIAILVREGHEGVAVEKLLRAHNVPAIVSGMGNVLQSDELAEIDLLLQAIASPRRSTLVRAALGTTLWGLRAGELQAVHAGKDDARWVVVLETFTALRESWTRYGVLRVLQEIMADRNVAERLLPLPDGDRRLTNLRHVTELIHAAESAQHLGIDGLLRCIAGWRAGTNTDDEAGAEVTQLRLETDAKAVQIITVHRSKGLQYDIVFCPTLWNGRPITEPPFFADTDAGRVFDLGSGEVADRLRIANAARLAEDLRLVYVALTRARFRTYVTWAPVAAGQSRERSKLQTADGSVHSALGYLLCADSSLDDCSYDAAPTAAADRLIDRRNSWRDDLRTMATASAGTMAVTDALVLEGLVPWEPDAAPLSPLAPRVLPAEPAASKRFQTYAIGSFTSLTRSKVSIDRDDVARDRDEETEETVETEVAMAVAPPTTPMELPSSDFRTFPAGRREGTLLHTLFEQSRFDDAPEVLRPRVSASLQKARMAHGDEDPQIDAVVTMMHQVFTVPWALPGSTQTFRLCDVPPRAAKHEWQFLVPCAQADRPLTTARLVQCFRRSEHPTERAYAAYLQTLSAAQLDGYLQGFVDLVFQMDGRWYVADWKSNKLPLAPDSYTQDALEAAMHAKHYTLQAHLYVVALHRFLRTRLADYDYDRHIGGFAYAYLRGFVPGASVTGHGWCTHRPSRALVESIDAILDGGVAQTIGRSA